MAAPGTQPYSLTVNCPVMGISPASLSNGVAGTAYTASLTASGGSAPYTWSVVSGTLPPGLSMDATGLISGTPTQATTSTFTVRVVDAYNCSAPQVYTLTVNCPTVTITPTTLPSAYYGVNYGQQLTSGGGTGPYTYSVIAGSPPRA